MCLFILESKSKMQQKCQGVTSEGTRRIGLYSHAQALEGQEAIWNMLLIVANIGDTIRSGAWEGPPCRGQ